MTLGATGAAEVKHGLLMEVVAAAHIWQTASDLDHRTEQVAYFGLIDAIESYTAEAEAFAQMEHALFLIERQQ